jgi:hypothetical protein
LLTLSWLQETKKPCDLQGFFIKRLMGLEPTTFCMASSGDSPGSQQECRVSVLANAVGLRPITADSDTIWTLEALVSPRLLGYG